jgi:hypothetical protein
MVASTMAEWVDRLPDVVQHALASGAHPLHRMLRRLDVVAERLALGPGERALVACLLALDVDEDVHGKVMRGRSGGAASRSDIIHVVRGSTADALEALVSLERRGVVRAGDDLDRPWAAVSVTLARAVRDACMRAEAAAPTEAPPVLGRVAHAIERVVLTAARTPPRGLHVVIRGRRGSGRDSAASTMLRRLDTAACARTPLELRGELDALEPALSGRAAVWDGRGATLQADDLALAAAFLARSPTICVSIVDVDDDAPAVADRTVFAIDTDPRDAAERAEGWTLALAARVGPELRPAVALALAERTRAGVGLAGRVAATVMEPGEGTVEAWASWLAADLEAALQPSTLRGVSVERCDETTPSPLVAPPVAERLSHMLAMMRQSSRLAAPTRRGVKALLSGPSGTGKTLTARWVARELGRPLYRIDLATVVSKWIGETEKNLRVAMHAAEAAGAVLLFDEGDALFGSRGEVSRGSDRYANMEVSYMLQALELLDGLAIVTTNLRGNIDRAFLRRFDVTVEFHPPDAALRLALWRQELGDAASAISDEMLERVAADAELSGGNIAVACRTALALALSDGTPITDVHLARAVVARLRAVGSNVAASRWLVPDVRAHG